MIDQIAQFGEVLSIVVGVVISVKSFNYTREKEAEARIVEAQKPYYELRQQLYLEAIKSAAILANADVHSEEEVSTARKRFRNLYVAELSMVEAAEVEQTMMSLAEAVDPSLRRFSEAQNAAYNLARKMGSTYTQNSLAINRNLLT